jgi:hypothetical protein
MGMPAVKNWALFANYGDKSLMRNYVTLMLGRSLTSMDFTANCIFVEVYYNDQYDGLYCLQDQMEAKPSRVNVEGFTKDASGKLTDVGFMLELYNTSDALFKQREPDAVNGRDYFKLDNNIFYLLEYPKYDDDGFEDPAFYKQAFDYIKKYVEDVRAAIDSGSSTQIKQLCDWNSFIDYFLVEELSKEVDSYQMSIFVNKKVGGKMQMGPLWDFDIAYGNANTIHEHIADTSVGGDWYETPAGGWYLVRKFSWFNKLMSTNAFYTDFRARFRALKTSNIQYTIDSIDGVRNNIRTVAEKNFNQRWSSTLYVWTWANTDVLFKNTYYQNWNNQVDYLQHFLRTRAQWMYDNMGTSRPTFTMDHKGQN